MKVAVRLGQLAILHTLTCLRGAVASGIAIKAAKMLHQAGQSLPLLAAYRQFRLKCQSALCLATNQSMA